MGARILWTEATDARIRDMRGAGSAWDAIAREIGVSARALLTHAREIGMSDRTIARARRQDDPELIERVRALAAVKPNAWAIARACRADWSTILRLCKAHGIALDTADAAAPATFPAETRAYTNRGEPLPAGHPTSWGAITAGTLLDGVPYR